MMKLKVKRRPPRMNGTLTSRRRAIYRAMNVRRASDML